MNIKEILQKSDELFDTGRAKEASQYLEQCLKEAEGEQDWFAGLPILNELMGYYRSISKFDQAWEYALKALEVVLELQLGDTLGGVTTYLNIANIYRATGESEQAIEIYLKVEDTYKKEGLQCDYRLASLYNNISVAFIESGNEEKAMEYGERAIAELKEIPESADAQATAYSNLAGALLKSQKPDYERVELYLERAVEIMERECDNSPHYCVILAMRAYVAYLKGDKTLALELYEKAMEETKKHYGENLDYERLVRNYNKIREELGQ